MSHEKPLSELVKPDWISAPDWQATLEKVGSLERIRADARAHAGRTSRAESSP